MVFFYILAGGRNKAQKRGNLMNQSTVGGINKGKGHVGKLAHMGVGD